MAAVETNGGGVPKMLVAAPNKPVKMMNAMGACRDDHKAPNSQKESLKARERR